MQQCQGQCTFMQLVLLRLMMFYIPDEKLQNNNFFEKNFRNLNRIMFTES